ncbi:UMTA protein [Colletotrichum musicola]|uniref:UMTA protein n=1 Tax=Colletotrichum musicola TaxID=2175873 RepID=A0A8H6KBQ2_9PEZI|nr:UMTA protein [Colletotrichum musicola]
MMEDSTIGVDSSVKNYRIENGRTYHAYKDGKYLFPNDAREQERLGKTCLGAAHASFEGLCRSLFSEYQFILTNTEPDDQHRICKKTFHGRLGIAPPCLGQNVGRVLDLGTGTGIWAIEFGDEHPESEASKVHGHQHFFPSASIIRRGRK